MDNKTLCEYFIEEIKGENGATRQCLERIPESLFEYKPHETSMKMGYLTLLVAEIPGWITAMIKDSKIDLATYPHIEFTDTASLVKRYDQGVKDATDALKNITDEQINTEFELQQKGNTVWKVGKIQGIGETINHWVHHRGQLTVYMRLNGIKIPSIYGPSADDKGF